MYINTVKCVSMYCTLLYNTFTLKGSTTSQRTPCRWRVDVFKFSRDNVFTCSACKGMRLRPNEGQAVGLVAELPFKLLLPINF